MFQEGDCEQQAPQRRPPAAACRRVWTDWRRAHHASSYWKKKEANREDVRKGHYFTGTVTSQRISFNNSLTWIINYKHGLVLLRRKLTSQLMYFSCLWKSLRFPVVKVRKPAQSEGVGRGPGWGWHLGERDQGDIPPAPHSSLSTASAGIPFLRFPSAHTSSISPSDAFGSHFFCFPCSSSFQSTLSLD